MEIRNKWTATLMSAALLALVSADALAMRCGTRLITKGDPQSKVLKYCGEPVQKRQSLGLRAGVYRQSILDDDGSASRYSYQRGYFWPYGGREVVIEDWLYNFGPSKLMRRIIFEDGFVEEVESLGYGYRE